jgi:hypothetical protein
VESPRTKTRKLVLLQLNQTVLRINSRMNVYLRRNDYLKFNYQLNTFSCKDPTDRKNAKCDTFCGKPENKNEDACKGSATTVDCTAADKKYASDECLKTTQVILNQNNYLRILAVKIQQKNRRLNAKPFARFALVKIIPKYVITLETREQSRGCLQVIKIIQLHEMSCLYI